MKCLVSVIFPIHEDNCFLKQAIDSILFQSYSNLELIIVANGCSQEFLNKLIDLERNNKKLKLIKTDIRYLPFALNLGVYFSQGEFIARMDSDDISHLNRIESQVTFLLNNKDIDIVGSNVNYINENDKVFGQSNYHLKNEGIRSKMYRRVQLAHPSVMFRKKIFQDNGGYMFGTCAEDYDLWLRLMRDKNIKFANIKESLVDYRIHSFQATNKKNSKKMFAYDFSLKFREIILEFKFKLLIGLISSFSDFIYMRFFKK